MIFRSANATDPLADAKLLRELLTTGRLPECYIPPAQVLEWRALLELYQDLRAQHTGWAQRIQSACFHQGATAPGRAGIVRVDRARLHAIVDEQPSISGGLQVNTALAVMDTLADHLDRLLSTARSVKGARALMHDIYGVGPLSSLALCAWLCGADRFTSSRKAVRFVGLDITVHSSDGKRGPAGSTAKGRRCRAGCCSKPPRPPPARAHPATATTPMSKTATTRTGPACPEPAASSDTPTHILTGLGDDAFTIVAQPGRADERRSLNHGADTRGEGRQSAVSDDGHHRGQLPPTQCQTAPPPTTMDGDHGRPRQTERPHPARGPPDQSSCRGPETLVRQP